MAGQTSQTEFTSSSKWSPIVSAIYPDILSSTHSVPPIYFRRVPYRRQIIPGTDHVPGTGPVPGAGLPALVLEEPLVAGDPLLIHDLTPDCLPPLPSAPSQQPMSASASQPSMSTSANQQPVSSASQKPVSSASQKQVSSASQKPVSSASQKPVSSASQQSVSSAGQQSVSSASQKPTSSTPHNFLNMDPLRNLLSSHAQQKRKPVLPHVWQTDVNDDEAQAQVLTNLQELAKHRKEVMFIVSQLNFTDYLNKPMYAAAVTKLPAIPMNPQTGTQKIRGDFDILITHRQYGIMVGELKTVGRDPAFKTDAIVSKTVKKALSQLDKAKTVVSHLVSDVASPGLAVRTTLFLPFVSTEQLERILLADPQLEKDACSTLGAANASEAAQVCCCSNQLSDPSTWWDVTPANIQQLETWWQKRMDKADPMMNDHRYVEVVARFVGPATSIRVNCTVQPRLEVKTVDQAVHELGQQLSTLVLTPEQMDLMQQRDKDPLVFLAGPPGTGKTVMLTLVGLCRLRRGKDVHVVSGYINSMAASCQIKNQLETTLASYSTSPSGCGKVFLHHYNLEEEAEKDRAVRELTALGPDVFLIFDELTDLGLGLGLGFGPGQPPEYFSDLLKELMAQVTDLRLWGAGIVHGTVPLVLLQIRLSTPLRSAPSILREVQKEMTAAAAWQIHPYNNTTVSAAGDGMRVEWLVHDIGDLNGHTTALPENCFLCGQNVAAVLRRMGVGVPGSNINYNDVFVLANASLSSGTGHCDLVRGLQHDGLPVRVMADPDKDKASWEREVGEVTAALWNSIVVAGYNLVHGMERKVVVVLGAHDHLMLLAASRATTQLVVVKFD